PYSTLFRSPVCRRIAEGALAYSGLAPTGGDRPMMIVQSGSSVEPRSHARSAQVMPVSVAVGGPALMPDVRGLSGREAVRVLAAAGSDAQVSGAGFGRTQLPEAGAPLDDTLTGRLLLTRYSSYADGREGRR